VATPSIIAVATLAGRRWGPSVSGWIAGIPLTSGPLALYLAFEQGTAFAANAALGVLAGLIAVAAFCVVYARLASHLPWLPVVLLALFSFTALTALLRATALSLLLTAICVAAAILLALLVLPARAPKGSAALAPRWDIPLRMVLATLIVVGLTSLAAPLGSRLAGLLAPVPVYAGLMTVFAHRLEGSEAAIEVLRGVLFGAFGFGAFFLCLALTLPAWGVVEAFTTSVLVSLSTQASTYMLLQSAVRGYVAPVDRAS
jgi:hypothetical protein